jgi:tetratricopeptide (TPR) repeat protein
MITGLMSLGKLALANHDFQEALNIFFRILEQERSAEALNGIGAAFMGLKDVAAARWAYAKALEIEPLNHEANQGIELAVVRPPVLHKADYECRFRVAKQYLQIRRKSWQRFFIKGINLGLGLPGFFPGEYPVRKGTYLKWFRQIAELGVNSLRIYTLHPPWFYEALAEFNRTGSGELFLFQGVWLELPEDNNFSGAAYQAYVERSIRETVDAVAGNITLPERHGYPAGVYAADVSRWLVAFMLGREWEACAVRGFNEQHQRVETAFKGRFLSIGTGTPFEAWLTATGNSLMEYESAKYGCSHPLTIINWPTLDPLEHPSESTYENGLRMQGIEVNDSYCNENEDVEQFDPVKIVAVGGGGFFATYHVYPYYPDFMNNDYLNERFPYRAYLEQLRRHHGDQPVLIAEFGVPSSRELTHWHQQGWHHGGHDEVAQGTINALMMESIHDAGLAGGILFSWFDEWFKRNWLFLPYEAPAERKANWFNLQDAEENYGLLEMYPGYPGKCVTLSGNTAEWADARILYEKKVTVTHRVNDGRDGARTLTHLRAQHDEGFLYLSLETAEPVDFGAAHYLIGLDTCSAGVGESFLPFLDNAASPAGLTFLLHLAGESHSRILVSRSYDKFTNADIGIIRPVSAEGGGWIVMQNMTGSRRISKDGKNFYPARVYSMSKLRHGSLDVNHSAFTSLADFFVSDRRIELRLPWGLLNYSDPSSNMVIWMERGKRIKKSEGIGVLAWSYKPASRGFCAEGPASDSFPVRGMTGDVSVYHWSKWDKPLYHTRLKKSYEIYCQALSRIPE